MKKNNWLRVTLTILLTFIVLAGVAGAGFRMGIMQSANLSRNSSKIPLLEPMHRFENDFNTQQRRGPQMTQGFGHNGPEHGGFGHRRGGHGFSPLFGLLHLVVLGLILWGGYSLYRKSGWQFVKVNSPEAEPSEAKPATKKKK